ncbi:hypothetical protein [Marinimicrobium agarilyticum]|uniref:hypothetical protein n=1 Tax=Marinimicrobium agarilyticum TaxID=306546 RepID=UPI00047F638A|nr:hypothetical protein [Marinimicrobium agarilyticum]
MKSFSEYAYEKMIDLFNNHSHEVGSQLKKREPVKYEDYESTDCITYSLNVISYAFKKIGEEEAARQVWRIGAKGTDLAKYLVNSHNWKGVYINPDAKHPVDSDPEHTYTSHIATQNCKYYQIPLEYIVQNYSVTPKKHSAFQQLNESSPVTTLNELDIASLEQVSFGFGISRGGMHTWVYAKGKVYEVHWDKVGSELYEATSLRAFPWISGAIFIPSDQSSYLTTSSKLKCGS